METFVDFIRNQIVRGHYELVRYLPYLTTLFVFVQFGNLGGSSSIPPAERPHGPAGNHGHLQPADVHQRRDFSQGLAYFKNACSRRAFPGRSTSC